MDFVKIKEEPLDPDEVREDSGERVEAFAFDPNEPSLNLKKQDDTDPSQSDLNEPSNKKIKLEVWDGIKEGDEYHSAIEGNSEIESNIKEEESFVYELNPYHLLDGDLNSESKSRKRNSSKSELNDPEVQKNKLELLNELIKKNGWMINGLGDVYPPEKIEDAIKLSKYKHFCDECDYKCKRRGDLDVHKAVHSNEYKFFCDECDYKCKLQRSLKQHKMIHNGEFPFCCDECDYKCRQKEKLKTHKMIHNGEFLYFCGECDYKCRQKADFKKHKMTHTDEYQYFCDQCDYKCKQKGNLNEHKMIHKDIFNFFCDECDYKCKLKRSLKQHKMIHSNEFLFFCDECDYKCRHKRALNQHKVIHSNECKFFCDECDYKCKLKVYLNSHKKVHRKNQTMKLQTDQVQEDLVATGKNDDLVGDGDEGDL